MTSSQPQIDEGQKILEKFDRESLVRNPSNRNIKLFIAGLALFYSLYHLVTTYYPIPQLLYRAAHVAIGLALIFGLFTWLASAATIALVVSFSLSGMFYWVNMWFIPVAMSLMNGSGRAFGLDYYVIPWIQRKLSKWWYGDIKAVYKPGLGK